jgi:uncharacterized protein (TIGR00255 family)
MTGFGQAKAEYNDKVIRIEIKSLNARATEIRCKLPSAYRDREIDIRKKIMDNLQRGKLELSISLEGYSDENNSYIDAAAFKKYYRELANLKEELNIHDGDILQSILRIPNVIGQNDELADDDEWNFVENCLDEAIKDIQRFRIAEGDVLKKDLLERVSMIEKNLKSIEPFEARRLEKIKERLRKNLDEFMSNQHIDHNRFEQEIIYYMEKLDINEEKVRLIQHCQYFKEETFINEEQKGRKLSFIAQEMGREINTMGAKAQDSDIQQYVVLMKDELEKLKEQLANIL